MNIALRLLYAALLLPSWFIALLMHWRSAPAFIFASPLKYADHSRDEVNVVISILIWTILFVLIFDICL